MNALTDRVVARAIITLGGIFPQALDRALPSLVAASHPKTTLKTLIDTFPIECLVVRGDQGIFQGSVEDLDVVFQYAIDRQWSPILTRRVIDFFGASRTGSYVDVGANIGLMTVPVAASQVHVLAFEPVSSNYAHLMRNLTLNDVERFVTPHNCALLDREGSARFELSPRNHGDHRLRVHDFDGQMGEDSWETVNVRVACLDSFFDEVRDPLIIKIDTQGSEPLVIDGGRRVFDRAAVVICEFSPYQMNRMGTDVKVVLELISKFDCVEIYETESEVASQYLSGLAAKAFLDNYHQEHRHDPWGHYLNLIAIMDQGSHF